MAKIAVAADAAAGATAEMEMTAKDEMDARSAAMATANAEAEAEAEKAQAELSADQVLQAEGAQASQASEQQEGAQAAGGPRCRSIMPAVPDEWCEASCAVSAQSCPTTHCKCDGDGAEPSLNAHAAAYATVKAQGKQLVEAAKAKRLANKNGGQAGVDFRRLASLPPGAAVPVQGVPPMSDITAGMPGLDFNERGLGETDNNPEGAHKGEHSPAHHATRLTRTAEGVVATEGVTDGVHGPHGESMSLSPEPASGTGLHGEKFGAARTHDPSARATVAPSEIGVHSETASEIASGQPADGSALAPASEGKHTGSTLTIGGAAGGAAPSVFDAATLKRLAAAAAAHTKTQLAETNVPRQRLRKHGVPILGADGLPIRPDGRHNNNRVGLANAAANAAAAGSSVQEDETPGGSALGATLKAGLGGSSVSSSVSTRNRRTAGSLSAVAGLAAAEQTSDLSKLPQTSPAAEAAAAPAESPAAEAEPNCVSVVATATDRWCDDNCAVNNCPPSICMCGEEAVAHRAEVAAGASQGAEVSPAPTAGAPTWEDAHPADAGVPLAAPGTTAGDDAQPQAQQQQQEDEVKSLKASKHSSKASKHSSSSKHHSSSSGGGGGSAKHMSSAHRSALEKSAKELGEGEDLSEMSESDLRKLAKRAIAAQTDNAQQQQQEAEAGADDAAAQQSAEGGSAQTETSSLAETLAKQTALLKPSDLHEKKLTPDEKKLLKHEKKAAERAEANEAKRSSHMSQKGAPASANTAPAEDLKLDAADEEINAWLRQQPQQWLKEQLRLAVDEHSTGAAGASQLAGLQAAAAAAGVDTSAAAEAAPAPAAAAAAAAPAGASSLVGAATEDLVCVSLVSTATDEWCSSFCAEHSCPESMCKCESAGGAPALA